MEPITAAIVAKPAMQLISGLFKPLLKRIENEISAQSQVAFHRLFGSYESYLDRTYERHTFFSSIVFKNEQRRLCDFYIPLKLNNTRDKATITVDRFPKADIDELRRLLIVDTAGMGKTTLLKFLFLRCVEEQGGIPLFVELRKLSAKHDLGEFLLEQLSDAQGKCQPDLFYRLLESGDFVIFLDGYDEISEAERPKVTASIQSFIEKSPKNRYILTSRDEAGLVAFASFQRFTINPLEKLEAYTLLRKYADGALAEALIAKLESPENAAIHEFLTNPLLTSLLFKSFEYKQIIPLKRHIFYRQVYEALFEVHDLTKEGGEFQRGKKCGLDVDRFDRILRAYGALTYKLSRMELAKDESLDAFGKACTLVSESKVSPSLVLHDATHAVPLLVADGNYIRWSHRSIQEYFAAQYICKNTKGRQSEILLKYYGAEDSSKHLNLILLCADIDRTAFDHSIGTKIAESLLHLYEAAYRQPIPGVGLDSLELRRSLTVGQTHFLLETPPPLPKEALVPEREAYAAKIHALHEQITGNAPKTISGSSIRYGQPGVGCRHTNFTRFIELARQRVTLPFIVDNASRPLPKVVLGLAVKAPIQVTDDPASPLNSSRDFDATTSLIRHFAEWRFDAAAARQYLSDIKKQATAKDALEPW